MKQLGKLAILFAAIGLLIYAGVYFAAEQLLYRTGHSNPFFKIATMQAAPVDWVILGASHAMPLDFADFNAQMERETSQHIVNLASPGTGPLYNRFVLEHFLREHRARRLLYVLDSFAFYSGTWNEERFADPKLLRRTPLDVAVARQLWNYVRYEGVAASALADYVTGFSKINDRERFQRDVWEGEPQFDRVYRASASAVKQRIAYLYPQQPTPAALSRYLDEFAHLIDLARQHGVSVVVIKMPVPAAYRSQLPDEAAFDEAILRLLATRDIEFHDFSASIGAPGNYFDTDHLNRTGLTQFFGHELKAVIMSGAVN